MSGGGIAMGDVVVRALRSLKMKHCGGVGLRDRRRFNRESEKSKIRYSRGGVL